MELSIKDYIEILRNGIRLCNDENITWKKNVVITPECASEIARYLEDYNRMLGNEDQTVKEVESWQILLDR